jgi:hypothetical protein
MAYHGVLMIEDLIIHDFLLTRVSRPVHWCPRITFCLFAVN